MQFTPRSYNQLISDLLLARGDADFEITGYQESQSKDSKRPMATITYKAKDLNGRTGKITHFIMLDNEEAEVMKQYYEVCYSAGKGYLYERGHVNEELVGGKGKFLLGIKAGNNGYADKNNIVKFVLPKPSEIESSPIPNDTLTSVETPFDDDINF